MGFASSQLKGLVDGKNAYWLASGNLTQTIFDGGRLRNNLRLSEAQKQEQVFAYQRTIKQAFQSVSDALIGLEKYREFREQEEQLGGARVWVLPSTSGAARRFWKIGPWEELAETLREEG